MLAFVCPFVSIYEFLFLLLAFCHSDPSALAQLAEVLAEVVELVATRNDQNGRNEQGTPPHNTAFARFQRPIALVKLIALSNQIIFQKHGSIY